MERPASDSRSLALAVEPLAYGLALSFQIGPFLLGFPNPTTSTAKRTGIMDGREIARRPCC